MTSQTAPAALRAEWLDGYLALVRAFPLEHIRNDAAQRSTLHRICDSAAKGIAIQKARRFRGGLRVFSKICSRDR